MTIRGDRLADRRHRPPPARLDVRKLRTAALDVETDPFRPGRMPLPFCCCIALDDGSGASFWGSDCVPEAMAWLRELPDKFLIFAHAGGRFDFHFLWDYIDDPVKIIAGGRLLEFAWEGHVFRDSYAILPLPLHEFSDKPSIDMAKLEPDVREDHRAEITDYCAQDCDELLKAVRSFRHRFEGTGRQRLPLTIGSLALREFTERHDWQKFTRAGDLSFRPWYFGGRTQCFAGGIVEGPFIAVDINSHHGAAMALHSHGVFDEWVEMDPKRHPTTAGPWFARVVAENNGALPWRDPKTGEVHYDISYGEFHVCGHELIPAISAGLVKVNSWLQWWRGSRPVPLSLVVTDWMAQKIAAERAGDRLGRQIAKLIMANIPGKLAQDPERFRDWTVVRDPSDDTALEREGWQCESSIRSHPDDWLELWSRPSRVSNWMFNNVAIAASILSASRAILLAGLDQAEGAIYCDTDAIFCREFKGEIDPEKLGAWKVEARAEWAAIAGRKTYCLYNKEGRRVVPVKWASKGETLSPLEIIRMARGGAVDKVNAAPRFSLRGAPMFVKRTYRRTV